MYTALIVDDEPLVQVGLQSMIDWSQLGVRLLPCASNGLAAWQIIATDHPDLVITDIKMPLMDGLELMGRCRAEAEPCPNFIVLTSHEDFAFAREALKHRVTDYLVKLELTPSILTQAVVRALAQVEPRSGGPKEGGSRHSDDRWTALLGETGAADAEAEAHLAEPRWSGKLVAAATCQFGDGPSETRPYAVNMLCEILGREFEVQEFLGPRGLVLVLGVGGLGVPAAAARFTTSLTAALVMVQKYFNGVISVGLGSPRPGLGALGASWRESLAALDAAPKPGKTEVYHLVGPGSRLTGDGFRAGLVQALVALDREALASWFDRARETIALQGRLTEALDLGTAALYAVPEAVTQGEALVARIFSNQPEGPKSLYSVPAPGHVAQWLTTLEGGLVTHLEAQGTSHQEKLVESMQRYIETHYRERLQLKSMADQFRLSPNYAGTLFRRFSGRSFSESVCEVKVAKAREMLASQKYRIYEISEFLGFENTYYFSKVFRRVTGTSPREYQKDNSFREKC
jgi:two-component system response regulator YesN